MDCASCDLVHSNFPVRHSSASFAREMAEQHVSWSAGAPRTVLGGSEAGPPAIDVTGHESAARNSGRERQTLAGNVAFLFCDGYFKPQSVPLSRRVDVDDGIN